MPASKRAMQLVLGLLSIEDAPISCEKLQTSIHTVAQELIPQIPYALQYLWKKGQIVRSSKKLDGRYFYFLSTKKEHFFFAGKREEFVLYEKKSNAKELKKNILEIIEKENIALKLSEITKILNSNYDEVFLKRVQFHLQKFVKEGVLERRGKPHQYYLKKRGKIVAIKVEKSSLPERIFALLEQKQHALSSSEIFEIINSNKQQAKPAALSLALARLTKSGRLVRSSTRLGARESVRGHLFAVEEQMIESRLRKIKEAKLKND